MLRLSINKSAVTETIWQYIYRYVHSHQFKSVSMAENMYTTHMCTGKGILYSRMSAICGKYLKKNLKIVF